MHRDTNKWRQHVSCSCSLSFPSSLSLPHSVSPIISLSYLSLSLPLSLIIPHAPCLTLTFLMLIRVLFLYESCCRPKDFAESAAARLLHPRDDSDNLASYEECLRTSRCYLHLHELLHQYTPIASDLHPGGNALLLPSPFSPLLLRL